MISKLLVLFSISLTVLTMAVEPLTKPAQPLDTVLGFAKGNQEFKEVYYKQHEKDFMRLVKEGQEPATLFIGCSDSRMVPDLIVGTDPGDLFVIRTAGNFVPTNDGTNDDGVSATIQYAIEVVGVKHIIVCGHSHCGAIKGLFETLDANTLGTVKRWLRYGDEAKRISLLATPASTSKEERLAIAEKLSVVFQVKHLLTFPYIKKRVDNGTLELHGWYYKLETGEIEYYDPETFHFEPLKALLQIEANSP